MLTPARIWRRLRALLGRRRFEADLDEEMQFHLDMEAESRGGEGARRAFGNITRAREEVRDAHGLTAVDDLRRDVHFAFRSLRRAPGYTAVALLILALGIGGTVAVFTVVNVALLQPLPFPQSGRIMAVTGVTREGMRIPVSIPSFRDWKAESRDFATLAAYNTRHGNLLGGGEPLRASITSVTGEFFPTLQVAALRGRTIGPGDHTDTQPAVIVLSHAFWLRAFGGEDVLGKSLSLGGTRAYQIVGVMPADFDFPSETDVWISRYIGGTGWQRNAINDEVIGRLRDGVTVEAAGRGMALIAQRLKTVYPSDEENQNVSADVRPLAASLSEGIRTWLLIVQATVALVLLVGCANLASAGLARGVQRERELGVRTALGASRSRLLRQLLTEHLILGLAGGALGVALSWILLRVVSAAAPVGRLPAQPLTPGPLVLAVGLGLSLVVGLGVGILPALFGSRSDLRAAMGSAGGGQSRRRASAGWVLVAGEVALSLMLLIGAGLLIHSFGKVLAQDPGARMDQVLTADVVLPFGKYDKPGQRLDFWERLLPRVRELPGVQSAAITSTVPLGRGGTGFIEIEGREGTATAGYRLISDDYLETMGLRLMNGRGFAATDDSTHPHVTLINQAMAEKYWPGESPIGKRFKAKSWDSHPDTWLAVIGVVNNVLYWTLENDPQPEHFVYDRQRPDRLEQMSLVMHSAVTPDALTPLVRMVLRQTDPDVPADFSTMVALRDDTLRQRRFVMSLLGGFAGFALLLASIGIYGVLAYVTAARTREIGVRVALGARRDGVLRLVLRQAAFPVLIGIGLGLAGAWAVSRLMASLLFGVSPGDPLSFLLAPATMLAVAALACVVPVRRAFRIDPMVAIRSD